LPQLACLTSHALVLGRSQATRALRQQCLEDLAEAGINCTSFELEFDCCEADLNRIEALIAPVQPSPDSPQEHVLDAVIAFGGGTLQWATGTNQADITKTTTGGVRTVTTASTTTGTRRARSPESTLSTVTASTLLFLRTGG
jgi:hypothetical protein